ncbi:guanylate binding protein 1 [Cavenderia fasciculata]|uniref:Guanylate binding protein 1 n=1 Tax=Cavenderia fasciculata TaxID=261658 RepID=F4PMK7_CACFS|nr:guanylate binding protein 1 [Cavenderia fasciculata]EGG23654.1 guanylate binding protein 1 [Cavenderia fasciculata]|eukprot:XP_004361505.1 guanylate binding protein 1 [Cavenderia fasciculata]
MNHYCSIFIFVKLTFSLSLVCFMDIVKVKDSNEYKIIQHVLQALNKSGLKLTNNFFNAPRGNGLDVLADQPSNDISINNFMRQLMVRLQDSSIKPLDEEKMFSEYKKKLVLEDSDYRFYNDIIDSGQLANDNDKISDGGPIPFLYPNNCSLSNANDLTIIKDVERTHLVLNPRAASIIQQIQGPLAIVSVIGPYRSGKSYILNRMMSKKLSRGFALGHTMESCTLGVWMWGAPFKHPIIHPDGTEEEVTVILLDTEGLGSTSKSTTVECDNQILSLSMLLSSNVVYNSVSVPTSSDFDKLYFITKLSQSIVVRKGENRNTEQDLEQFCHFFPSHFSWVFRDCHLTPTLNGIDECSMTTFMLEKSFKLEAETPDAPDLKSIVHRNGIRKFLLTVFKSFMAFTISHPGHEALRYNIEDIENPFTSQKFHTDVANFISSFKNVLQIKKGQSPGSRVNGKQLISQIEIYLEDIKNGKSINVESTWEQTLKLGYESITNEAVMLFQKEIHQFIHTMPISYQQFMSHYQQAIKKTDQLFVKILDLDTDLHYFQKFSNRYHDECAKFDKSGQLVGGYLYSVHLKNNEASINHNNQVIRTLVEKIINPVLKSETTTHLALVTAEQLVEREYFVHALGPKTDQVFDNYLIEFSQKKETFLSYLKSTNQFKESLAKSEADREQMRQQNSSLIQRQKDLEINIKTNQEIFQQRIQQMQASKSEMESRMKSTIDSNTAQYQIQIQQLNNTITNNINIANNIEAQLQSTISNLQNQLR